jgi:hypothetical protein
MKNKYKIECFYKEHNTDPFNIIDALAELNYQIPEASCFSRQKLKNVLTCYKWLNTIIESRGAVFDSIQLYVNGYRPKGGEPQNCYYAASKGKCPYGENSGPNCYLKIKKDLKATRSTSLKLQSSNISIPSQATVTRR